MLGINEYIRFIHGDSIDSIIGKDEKGTTINDILNYDNDKLESCHYFIQWIFPTNRISNFSNKCPILSKSDINDLRNSDIVINILSLFKDKMFEYWGIYPVNYEKMKLLNGHNGLRLSRAIECLNMFNINISYIVPILIRGIENKILEPKYEKGYPIWFIRYNESLNNL